ncbi:MAG TPA: hypothetical protein VNS63_03620 [Blastocatellia bacterium]|nr:hypothetical protein [Blastocatellia bacterium]
MKPGTIAVLALSGLLGAFHCLTAGTQAAGAGGASLSRCEVEYQAVEPSSASSIVEDSKRAIIETGMSESYFDKHFKLIKAVNEPADRRVEWSFSVNEYQAQLVDAIGFNTNGGKLANVHGIKNQLYSTHEIIKTLPRQRARSLLRSCIGEFDSESVIYRTLTVPGKARLYLTGRSIIKRENRQRETEGEQEGKFLFVGFVDVETGKCVKKLGRGSS